jgi:hypothetical protein
MSKLTPNQVQHLRKLAAKPDREIDLSDIPEIKRIPAHAVIGKFYRGTPKPKKQPTRRTTH